VSSTCSRAPDRGSPSRVPIGLPRRARLGRCGCGPRQSRQQVRRQCGAHRRENDFPQSLAASGTIVPGGVIRRLAGGRVGRIVRGRLIGRRQSRRTRREHQPAGDCQIGLGCQRATSQGGCGTRGAQCQQGRPSGIDAECGRCAAQRLGRVDRGGRVVQPLPACREIGMRPTGVRHIARRDPG
jgi:hypothetical protein